MTLPLPGSNECEMTDDRFFSAGAGPGRFGDGGICSRACGADTSNAQARTGFHGIESLGRDRRQSSHWSAADAQRCQYARTSRRMHRILIDGAIDRAAQGTRYHQIAVMLPRFSAPRLVGAATASVAQSARGSGMVVLASADQPGGSPARIAPAAVGSELARAVITSSFSGITRPRTCPPVFLRSGDVCLSHGRSHNPRFQILAIGESLAASGAARPPFGRRPGYPFDFPMVPAGLEILTPIFWPNFDGSPCIGAAGERDPMKHQRIAQRSAWRPTP